MAIWQVAAGDATRDYSQTFLACGVALIGPGDPGSWFERPPEDFGNEAGFVQAIATELHEGDILLLRTNANTIAAVGLVESDYQYLPQFDDVDCWDLQHARRVRWFELPEPHTFPGLIFGQIPGRLSRVVMHEDIAQDFVQQQNIDWQAFALPALPPEEPKMEAPRQFQDLVAQVHKLWAYLDQNRLGAWPMEHEMVAHFVVPFLRALGWPVELIAVEWNHIDVSVFSRLQRIPKNCHYLIEAKTLGEGFERARTQGIAYANNLGRPCDVVVTDGICYRMYGANEGFRPVAGANLRKLKQSAAKLFERMRRPYTVFPE